MQNINSTWEFVEKYFPNYSSSDEILRNNDLQKQIEEGAEDLQNEFNDSNAYIYEKAIEGYIESLKTSQPVFWSVEDFEARAESNFETLKENEPKEYQHLANWEQFYDKNKFADQLQRMISQHDANEGIHWLTIDTYLGNCEIK